MKKLKIYSKIFIILFFFISEASAIQDTSIKKQSDEIAKMLKYHNPFSYDSKLNHFIRLSKKGHYSFRNVYFIPDSILI